MLKNAISEERFLVYYGEDRHLVTLQRSRTGTVYAFQGFSDTKLATAGGYGYDKESQALADAIEKLTGVAVGGHGMGTNVVISKAKAHGVAVYGWSEILEAVEALHTGFHDNQHMTRDPRKTREVVTSALARKSGQEVARIVYGDDGAGYITAMVSFINSRMHADEILDELEK